MIPIKAKVERDHRLTVREWREISKVGWEHAGEVWHREILPRHFTEQGAREYAAAGSRGEYKRRTKKYEDRKLRKFGHRRPLVYTGDLEREVTRMREVRVVGDNSKRRGAVRIVLRGPRYLFAYRKDLKQPDKAAELRVVSFNDARLIAKRMDAVLTAELGKTTGRESVR